MPTIRFHLDRCDVGSVFPRRYSVDTKLKGHCEVAQGLAGLVAYLTGR